MSRYFMNYKTFLIATLLKCYYLNLPFRNKYFNELVINEMNLVNRRRYKILTTLIRIDRIYSNIHKGMSLPATSQVNYVSAERPMNVASHAPTAPFFGGRRYNV